MRPSSWRPETWLNPYEKQDAWGRAARKGYLGNRRMADGGYWISGMDCSNSNTLSKLDSELRELQKAYEEGAQAMLQAINALEALERNP